MQLGDWFLLTIAVLQVAAVCAYCWKRRWIEAALYGCYAVAQIMLLLLSFRARA